jgi:hypothetical protein
MLTLELSVRALKWPNQIELIRLVAASLYIISVSHVANNDRYNLGADVCHEFFPRLREILSRAGDDGNSLRVSRLATCCAEMR